MKTMNYIHINKLSKEPLYQQISSAIEEAIFSGDLNYGDQLPSEEHLSDAFGISRIVVRQAYQELATLKLIEAIKGKGSQVIYVHKIMNLLQNIDQLENFIHRYDLKVKPLITEHIHSNYLLNSTFSFLEEKQVFHSKRVYALNGHPTMVEDIFVPLEDETKLELSPKIENLVDWLKLTRRVEIHSIHSQIRSTSVKKSDAEFLECSGELPIFNAKYQYFNDKHEVCAFQEIQLLAHLHTFDIEVQR